MTWETEKTENMERKIYIYRERNREGERREEVERCGREKRGWGSFNGLQEYIDELFSPSFGSLIRFPIKSSVARGVQKLSR